MAFKRRYNKKFNTLWVANFTDTETFTPPANRKIVWVPRVNKTDASIFASGITNIAINDGKVPLSAYSKSAVFVSNPNFIKAAVGGDPNQPIETFNQAKCNQLIVDYINQRGGLINVVTTGSSETNPSNQAWGQDFNGSHTGKAVPQQYHWIDQAWQANLGPNNYYCGDYDGHGTARNQLAANGAEIFRAGYQSNEGAWNYMSTHTPFGNPFFTDGAYTYRHGLVKTYWDGSTEAKSTIFGMCTDLLFTQKALAFKGSNKLNCSFPFPGKSEFQNRSEEYSRLTGGAFAYDYGFTQTAQSVNTIIGIISMIFSQMIFMWEDSIRYGSDPNLVAFNIGSYTGSTPKATSNYFEYTAGNVVGYPVDFNVGHNAMLEGVKWYSDAVSWASGNWNYAPSRIAGTSTFNVVNDEYLLNTYKANQPTGFVFSAGNRRCLICWDLNTMPGVQTDYEWDCGGEIVPIKMTSGVPYMFFGQI